MRSLNSGNHYNKGGSALTLLTLVVVSTCAILFVSRRGSLYPVHSVPNPTDAFNIPELQDDDVNIEITLEEFASLSEKLSQQDIAMAEKDKEFDDLFKKLNQQEIELTAKQKEFDEILSLFQASLNSSSSHNPSKKVSPPLHHLLGFERRNLAPEAKETKKEKIKEEKVKKNKKVPKKDQIVTKKGRSLIFERKCKPHEFLQNINGDSSIPSDVLSPQLQWNFNRGFSTISKSIDDEQFPVSVSVFTVPTQTSFSVAQLSISTTSKEQIENEERLPFLQYDGQNLTDQWTVAETTTITNLIEYTEDKDTGLYFPVSDGNDYIYSLIGIENGEVNLCKVFIGSAVDTTTSCQFKVENFGTAVSDMLYIPQKNFLVALTDKNVMIGYTVTWSNSVPSLNYFGQLDTLDECYDGKSDSSDDKESGCNELPSPRSLSGLWVDDDNTFIYLCAPQGLLVFSLDTSSSSAPFAQFGTGFIGTDFCVQSLPTPYGLYVNTQKLVLFIPFVQFDPRTEDVPGFALLGSANPDVYVVYGRFTPTDDVGASSSDESGEETYDLVTSIAFSPNSNNVVTGMSPTTGKDQSFYEGGAIVISTVRYTDVVVGTKGCLSGDFDKDSSQPSYSNACPGSLVLNDICSGETTTFANDIINGPVYGLAVDNNMNILTQNGKGGLSYFSVGYTPGAAQSGVFLANIDDPCSSKGALIKTIISTILAAAALVIGIVALPVTGPALAIVGLGVGTAGAVVPLV